MQPQRRAQGIPIRDGLRGARLKEDVIDGIGHRKQSVLCNASVSVVAPVFASDTEKPRAHRKNFLEIEPLQPSSRTASVGHCRIGILAPHQERSFRAGGQAQGFPHPPSLPTVQPDDIGPFDQRGEIGAIRRNRMVVAFEQRDIPDNIATEPLIKLCIGAAEVPKGDLQIKRRFGGEAL